MPRELVMFGAFVPALVPLFAMSIALMWGIDHVAGHVGLYRYVWHPALFRPALFACVFGTLGLVAIR